MNAGVTPWIPAKGSVGASGDLAPLAHMSLTLLEKVKRGYAAANGCRPPKRCVRWGWSLNLAAKEGLALTQRHSRPRPLFALRGLFEAEDLFACGRLRALTTEAALGYVVLLMRVHQ